MKHLKFLNIILASVFFSSFALAQNPSKNETILSLQRSVINELESRADQLPAVNDSVVHEAVSKTLTLMKQRTAVASQHLEKISELAKNNQGETDEVIADLALKFENEINNIQIEQKNIIAGLNEGQLELYQRSMRELSFKLIRMAESTTAHRNGMIVFGTVGAVFVGLGMTFVALPATVFGAGMVALGAYAAKVSNDKIEGVKDLENEVNLLLEMIQADAQQVELHNN